MTDFVYHEHKSQAITQKETQYLWIQFLEQLRLEHAGKNDRMIHTQKGPSCSVPFSTQVDAKAIILAAFVAHDVHLDGHVLR